MTTMTNVIGKQPAPTFPDDALLSTKDNPYNPHDDWIAWNAWDEQHGYNTTNYLARLAQIDVAHPDWVQEQLINQAMLYILENDDDGIYIIVLDSNE